MSSEGNITFAQIDYRKGPTIVRTRLSVAVAAFILHAMQGPWPGAIGHTIKYLKAQGGVEIALQVLVLIPEEFTSITFTAQSKVNNVKDYFFKEFCIFHSRFILFGRLRSCNYHFSRYIKKSLDIQLF